MCAVALLVALTADVEVGPLNDTANTLNVGEISIEEVDLVERSRSSDTGENDEEHQEHGSSEEDP